MGILARTTKRADRQRFDLAALANQVSYLGQTYGLDALGSTMASGNSETPDSGFASITREAYRSHGPVFSCVLARMALFSEARFAFQDFKDGQPNRLFGSSALSLMERPWPRGTTRELLTRAEQDASLGGNFWLRKHKGRLWRLRPDHMFIILGSSYETDNIGDAIDAEVVGYIYQPESDRRLKVNLLPDEVAHWAPIPDPLYSWKGMSWITPVLRELNADRGAIDHKNKFFENAATPNMVVLPDAAVNYEDYKLFVEDFRDQHEGAFNAYKTLFLGGGSNVQTVGSNFKDMQFKDLQGSSETRIAAAAGVPPILAGFSEGLASATYSNYGMARRKFGDAWAHPQWGSFCAAIEHLLSVPSGNGTRLWYDARNIPFLREDQGDEATIRQAEAATVRTLVEAGFTPDSAVAFAASGNVGDLKGNHTGLASVQLVPPGGPDISSGSSSEGGEENGG